MALNFFYRILYVRFFFIAFSYSQPKVYRIFIIVSDDKMPRREKKIPMVSTRRGHGRSKGGTRVTTLLYGYASNCPSNKKCAEQVKKRSVGHKLSFTNFLNF